MSPVPETVVRPDMVAVVNLLTPSWTTARSMSPLTAPMAMLFLVFLPSSSSSSDLALLWSSTRTSTEPSTTPMLAVLALEMDPPIWPLTRPMLPWVALRRRFSKVDTTHHLRQRERCEQGRSRCRCMDSRSWQTFMFVFVVCKYK
ncbi:hypothetical protein GQ42DRAFT_62685 [Ramicandelaber brevisporus]|nr:hypothetical protein GQ42DRAFT_62685 [Ramicandelaber brevisporus]